MSISTDDKSPLAYTFGLSSFVEQLWLHGGQLPPLAKEHGSEMSSAKKKTFMCHLQKRHAALQFLWPRGAV